jgi:ParB family chromosome partitioning protein
MNTNASANKRRLGRGLAALIGDEVTEDAAVETARAYRKVPIEFLRANPNNPRKTFNDEELVELANSIKSKGLLQPIVVRTIEGDNNRFEIVAGERRWRAAQQAALHDVPILVHELNDAEALEVAIIENVQRADLNPIEEADGYQRLIDHFNYTQQQLADVVSKSRSHIANTLRLVKLPEQVQTYLRDGKLTAGHARTLVASDAPIVLANEIINSGLSVRDAERITQKPSTPKADRPAKSHAVPKDPDTIALECNLSQTLGLSVEIVDRGKTGGQLRINYRTLEQLDDVCARLLRIR